MNAATQAVPRSALSPRESRGNRDRSFWDATRLCRHRRQQFEELGSSANSAGVKLTKHLLWSSPAYDVVRMANELKADLIVVGTIGRRGVEGLLLGNTAESVLTHCDCDVLTVKPAGFVSPIKPATWPLHPGPEKSNK